MCRLTKAVSFAFELLKGDRPSGGLNRGGELLALFNRHHGIRRSVHQQHRHINPRSMPNQRPLSKCGVTLRPDEQRRVMRFIAMTAFSQLSGIGHRIERNTSGDQPGPFDCHTKCRHAPRRRPHDHRAGWDAPALSVYLLDHGSHVGDITSAPLAM